MKVIDLSRTICGDMPVYPGTEGPSLMEGSSYEADGFRETLLRLYSHTGTHMDAPNHLFAEKRTLDTFAVSQFIGSAVVLDCSDKGAGEEIGMQELQRSLPAVEQADFILFYTGWSRHWGGSDYFGDYPCLSLEVIDYLLAAQKKGVGLDTIGLDPIADTQLTRHRKLFQGGDVLIIENLCNLEQLGSDLFTLLALPLKFANADGAPTRAVALIEENFGK